MFISKKLHCGSTILVQDFGQETNYSATICHRSSEYAAAKEQFDIRLQRQSAALAKLKPEVLIAKLAKASREADDQAEALYDEFLAGGLTVENFISAYSKKKTVAHARNLKSSAALQTIR